MTIKEQSNKKACQKIKSFLFDTENLIYTICVSVVVLVAIVVTSLSNKSISYKDFSLNLIRGDYPTLICVSPQGGIRVYEQSTYTVFNDPDNGWQVYDTKQGHISSSTFHVSKCELK